MTLSKAEMETTVSYSAADEEVRIWTCIKEDLNKLRKDARFTEVKAARCSSVITRRCLPPWTGFHSVRGMLNSPHSWPELNTPALSERARKNFGV